MEVQVFSKRKHEHDKEDHDHDYEIRGTYQGQTVQWSKEAKRDDIVLKTWILKRCRDLTCQHFTTVSVGGHWTEEHVKGNGSYDWNIKTSDIGHQTVINNMNVRKTEEEE